MTVKERLVKQVEAMNEQELERLDHHLNPKVPEELRERRLAAWRGIHNLLSDPDDYAAFEKASQRRPLFDDRTLDLGSDDAPRLDALHLGHEYRCCPVAKRAAHHS